MSDRSFGSVPGGGGGAVSSVAGKTGAVTLVAADAGAVPTYATASHTTNFTATVATLHLVDTTGGAVTATLPAASTAGQQVAIKLNAGATAVTVVPSGTDTIGAAATTASITLLAEVWEFVSSGTGQWNLVAGNKSLASTDGRYAQRANNLSDLASASTARTNLGLGGAAVLNVGTAVSTVAAGDDTRIASHLLASGEETFSRLTRTDSINLGSQVLQLTYFTARKTETTTQVRIIAGNTASSSLTLARIGLYSIAANGDGTLVASTVSDTTLLNATTTPYTKSWAASYAKAAGQRYAVGVLPIGTGAGSLIGISQTGFAAELALAPRIGGKLSGQSDLPSTFTDASLATIVGPYWAVVLP